jgi:glutamate-1-semialdehyde 2,1-aminomutase
MGSQRLPGKVLKPLHGQPVLGWVTAAAKEAPGVDEVWIATSTLPADDAIEQWCEEHDIKCFRGSEQDVLSRFTGAALEAKADVAVRVTCDCPFLDPKVIGEVIALRNAKEVAYASNVHPPTWPDGLDCEAMTIDALVAAEKEATRPSERESVTQFIVRNRHRFPAANLICPIPGLEKERWVLDSEADYRLCQEIAEQVGVASSYLDILKYLDDRPPLRQLNSHKLRNEKLFEALLAEEPVKRPYRVSQAMLERAEKVIPLGSQTFSKSRVQYPQGHAPMFLTHGRGGRVWDVDGNEYVDLVCGLLPIVLGYCDPDVDDAIRAQLDKGIVYSLASELEIELAELLTKIIPSAEMVRFGKNGSDATSACVRIARAVTGRDRIAAGGYHGWQDWYIGATTRNKGVPGAVSALTHRFGFLDVAALEELLDRHKGEFAAVILETVGLREPTRTELAAIRDLTHRHGALLIFDEIITGFRVDIGGAQARYGVTPDLSAFGKSMANGMPISAVVGRADLMKEMEEIFFSSTFGGEALSLAAALATIRKMRANNVIDALWKQGAVLADGVRGRIARHKLSDVITVNGVPSWTLLGFNDAADGTSKGSIKTLLLIELLSRGVLTAGSHNMCYAHDDANIAHVLGAYDHALARVADAIAAGDIARRLDCPVIQPVFAVRG